MLPLTGSSSLPASLIHPGTATGCRIQNFHLFVPVHHHPVVELASPSFSTEADRARAKEFAALLNLQVVSVKESPGLAASRMGLIQGLEAMRLLEDSHASASDLDSLMTLGYGHPCGPLELSDRIGLDLRLAIASQLFEVTNNLVYRPPALLKEKVANGELGRKSGKGFFTWTHDGRKA
ncbi:MAG: 3-hydroxyacyl-CoA dehydrogenase family protein [Holophaga sp.]|nr:3-hydroxyacyl-CoA dehydrogenase family protein [Holophaga sp.]